MTERIAEASPRSLARMAGVFYLLTILTGGFALVFVSGRLVVYGDAAATATNILAHEPLFRLGFAADLIMAACYIVVTLLLYDLLKPVNRSVSLLAAFFGLVGCAVSLFGLTPFILLRDLVFFGLHCLLVGYLIFRSTFLYPPLANYLSPYNLAPGMLGEGLLILWLLVFGVNEQRWKEQAKAGFLTN